MAFLLALLIMPLAVVLGFLTSADKAVLFGRSRSILHADTVRTFRLHRPEVVTSDTPVVVGLHEFGGSSRRFAYYTALHNAFPEALVIYPDAVKTEDGRSRPGWNAGYCCGSGWVGKVDDVGFIVALVQQVCEENGIDEGKTFVTGFSNGAFLTHRLAAERPDIFDAAALSSGCIGCEDSRIVPAEPTSIFLMHGAQDTTVPIAGGPGKSDPNFSWLGFDDACEAWETINGDAAETKTMVYSENGHSWDGWRVAKFWTQKPRASVDVADFFRRQS